MPINGCTSCKKKSACRSKGARSDGRRNRRRSALSPANVARVFTERIAPDQWSVSQINEMPHRPRRSDSQIFQRIDAVGRMRPVDDMPPSWWPWDREDPEAPWRIPDWWQPNEGGYALSYTQPFWRAPKVFTSTTIARVNGCTCGNGNEQVFKCRLHRSPILL